VPQVYLNTDLLTLQLFSRRPWLTFLIHWIAWTLLYFITYIPTLVNSTRVQWEYVLFTYVIMGTVNFLLFYLVAFYLLPRIGIKQKRWIWLTVICLLLAVMVTFAKFRLENFRTEQLIRKIQATATTSNRHQALKDSLGFFSYRFRTYLQINIYNTLSIVFIAFAYRLMAAWYLQEKIRKELENQKLQAELSFLKMQVNPHFLFNALNNIYSLAVMEKSKKTGESVLKLSELMRYVLYEKEDAENKVSLDKEIRHINSYIDLEKLRHQGDIYINFSIEGETTSKRIVPLLLFPLIENACKHGLLTDAQRPVDINLKITDHQLNFSIENFINAYEKDKIGGIGIENVNKRLYLLYGKNYPLDVKKTEEKFIVNLHLPL